MLGAGEAIRITKLETLLVQPRWLFLKVHTDAGIVGLGEPVVEGRARTVAEAIKMHESTVSRVTSNKYILTPRGLFELRYFFTVSIAASGGGDAHSSESVRDRIKQMIDEERPANVLSDDAIVDMLKKSGVDIARRTVAKYREGMSIPSSVQRRREKRAMATAGR